MNRLRLNSTSLLLLARQLRDRGRPIAVWELARLCSKAGVRAHIAVATAPYIAKIVGGKKIIESRFTNTRQAPYGRVAVGDVLLFKAPAKGVSAAAWVASVHSAGPLGPRCAYELMLRYADGLALDQEFIRAKKDCRYATLIGLQDPVSFPAVPVLKVDRRPWVALADEQRPSLFSPSRRYCRTARGR